MHFGNRPIKQLRSTERMRGCCLHTVKNSCVSGAITAANLTITTQSLLTTWYVGR